jgi:membrane protease YdiL (CAAX protease family)
MKLLKPATLAHSLLIVVFVELLFVFATRVVLHYFPWTSLEAESIRTAMRIATAALYWWLLKPLILSRTPDPASLTHPLLLFALLIFLAIPVLVGHYALRPAVAMMFAVSSIPVGIKEEFLFRGIMQNLLTERFGVLKGILVTSTIFTLWHVGVWEPSLWTFGEIFLASMIIGLIYVRSGSIAAVIVLHAVYDAIYCFTPLMTPPLQENWGFVPMLAALALVAVWARRNGRLRWLIP